MIARRRALCAAVSPRSHGGPVGSSITTREHTGTALRIDTGGVVLQSSASCRFSGGTNEIQKNIISKMIVGL